MMSMTSSRPFASHFKYSYTVTEDRVVMVPTGPTSVILSDYEPASSKYSRVSKENYPHLEAADGEGTRDWKPVDAKMAENSKHVEHKRMEVKVRKEGYDAESYELLLTLLRQGELRHYGFETEDGPNLASARSACEFLSERVTLPYRKDGVTREKTVGPFIEEMPSEAELRAMQMLFNGHRKQGSSGLNPEQVLVIVEAVVEREMERLDSMVQDLMEPFMETETVVVPSESDEEEMVEVEQPMPEERDRVKQEFVLTLEGASA